MNISCVLPDQSVEAVLYFHIRAIRFSSYQHQIIIIVCSSPTLSQSKTMVGRPIKNRIMLVYWKRDIREKYQHDLTHSHCLLPDVHHEFL